MMSNYLFILFSFLIISTYCASQIPNGYLPKTPKAGELNNHWGYSNNKDYDPSRLVPNKTKLTVLDPQGKEEEIYVDDKDFNNAYMNDNCKSEDKPYYELCKNLKTCDECSNSNLCGWCGSTMQCLPGNLKDADCPGDCVSHWIFRTFGCTGNTLAGSLDNVAPEAQNLTHPEITNPKIEIFTENPVIEDKVFALQAGLQQNQNKMTVENGKNNKISMQAISSNPVLGVIHAPIAVGNNIEKNYFDLKTGKLIKEENVVKKHGKEQTE